MNREEKIRKCKNIQEAIDKWLLSPEDCEQYDWNDYNLKITSSDISILQYKDYTERFINFDNTLPLHKQSEEVLWALVEYLSKVKW